MVTGDDIVSNENQDSGQQTRLVILCTCVCIYENGAKPEQKMLAIGCLNELKLAMYVRTWRVKKRESVCSNGAYY